VRTVLRRVRYDGVMRCSRAFDHGGAALVMTSQLGPGVVHGDRLELHGTLDDDARLIVTGQAATRVLGGGARPASSYARWDVGSRARLELRGEPLVASAGGRYEATQHVALAREARVLISDAACAPAESEIRLRTTIEIDGVESLYDAVDVQCAAPAALGTLVLFGLQERDVTRATALLDELCAGLTGVEAGVGAYPRGVLVRVLAESLWPVHATLACLRDALDAIPLDRWPADDESQTIHLSNDVPSSSRYDALKS
jgi:urease accessory protein UreH